MTWPSSPVTGTTATINGVQYVYDAANSVWDRAGSINNGTGIDSLTIGNLVVTQTTHLGAASNVFISGGSPGKYLTGDGSGGLTWEPPQAGSYISNGTSNVNVPTDGNITVSIAGTTNTVVFTSTGVNIAGYANITGNITTGNISAGKITSSITTGTAPLTINSTTRVANLNVDHANLSDYSIVTRQTTGVFYPTLVNGNATSNYSIGVSPNIYFDTGSSTLTTKNITINNNANIDNLVASSNITTSNLSVSTSANLIGASILLGSNANVKLTGGTTGQYLQTDGTGNLSWAGVSLSTINNGTSNVNVAPSGNVVVTAVGNNTLIVTSTGANINGYANINGNITTSGNLTVTGNISASTLTSTIATGTAPLAVTSTTRVNNLNVARANVSDYTSVTNTNSGNVYVAFASGSGTSNYALQSNTAIYANISSGNLYAGNFIGNITGTVTGSATTASTVTTASQPNITSVGTLSGITVTGVANLIATSNTALGSVSNIHITGGTSGQYLKTDGSGSLSWSDIALPVVINGTSNVNVAPSGNIVVTVAGTSTLTITSTGANINGYANINGNATITGNIDVTGNVNASILTSNVATGTSPLNITSTTRVANLNVARANISDFTLVTTTASSNMYFAFASASSTGNYSLYSNTAIYANLSSSTLYAANYSGNVIGANSVTSNYFLGNATYLSALPAANLVGTVPLATAATTAGTVTSSAQPNITSVSTLTSLTVSGLSTLQQTTEILTPLSGATGVVVHDVNNGSTFYHSSPAANFTINFTNVPTTNNRTIVLTLLVTQGTTAYIPTALQINGVSQTLSWLASTAPTGTPSRTDLFGFTLTRVNNAWITYAYTTYFG